MPCVKSLHVPFQASLGITILKASPNLQDSTLKISLQALNFLSPSCIPFHHPSLSTYRIIIPSQSSRARTIYTIIFFDKKIKGWYLPSLKNNSRKIYLVQISKVAPAPEEKLFTETALTLEYLVLLPGVVTAL